jgi:hypothetical protein
MSGRAADTEEQIMDQSVDVSVRGARSVLGTMDELLRQPNAGFDRARSGAPIGAWALRVFAGSLGCCVLYGAASGFFAGGAQIGIAAVKAPLIVAWSALLCLPSLYVFGLLAGAPLTGARFVVTLVGFVGMLALVLVGLLPIEWLFSVSSRSLAFVVWLHLALWTIAVIFGARFLRAALPEVPIGAILLWLVLFCVVSFQVTTFMRPTLWRATNAPVVDRGKMFFLEHFGKSVG